MFWDERTDQPMINKRCRANSKSNWCATLRGGTRLVHCGKLDIHPSLTITKAVFHDYLM